MCFNYSLIEWLQFDRRTCDDDWTWKSDEFDIFSWLNDEIFSDDSQMNIVSTGFFDAMLINEMEQLLNNHDHFSSLTSTEWSGRYFSKIWQKNFLLAWKFSVRQCLSMEKLIFGIEMNLMIFLNWHERSICVSFQMETRLTRVTNLNRSESLETRTKS